MILEEATFKKFGYRPESLGRYSEKKILAKCDSCGCIREIIICSYSKLCRICASERRYSKLNEDEILVNQRMTQIMEQETFEKFGYHPSELKPKSHKKVLVKCKRCGKIREITKSGYHELCTSCSHLGRVFPTEVIEKIRKSNEGRVVSEETKRKLHDSHLGISPTSETREKLRRAHLGEKSYWFGKHFSEETRKKQSKMARERLRDPSNHPNWQGGKSFEPYCIKFNERIKEECRNKYGRRCFLCNKFENENQRKLSVHHVDYNRNQGCDDVEWRLVPLCDSCHAKTNRNREYYEDLIVNKLS